jgi:hypothetical protein
MVVPFSSIPPICNLSRNLYQWSDAWSGLQYIDQNASHRGTGLAYAVEEMVQQVIQSLNLGVRSTVREDHRDSLF